MSKKPEDHGKMHNYVKSARKGIGRKGLTQQVLAKMVGVHHTLISRRERGEVNVEGTTAEPLYKVIDSLNSQGMNMEVEEALINLSEPRSEDKALMAMVVLAIENGKVNAVQAVLKNDKSPASNKGFDPAHTLRVISTMRESMEAHAIEMMKAGDPNAPMLTSLAKAFGSIEAETRIVKAHLEPKPNDPPKEDT